MGLDIFQRFRCLLVEILELGRQMLHVGVADAVAERFVCFKLERIKCSGCLFDHRLGSREFKERGCYISTLSKEFPLELIEALSTGIGLFLEASKCLCRGPNIAERFLCPFP